MKTAGTSWSRRFFLRATAAAWAGIQAVPRRTIGAASDSPSATLRLGAVGIGGVGRSQIRHCAEAGFSVAALCDVDSVYAAKTFDLYPDARRCRDFREMLDAEGDRIDAVYCGTPDHTHAVISMAALKRRKYVMTAKPLTRTIHEARALAGKRLPHLRIHPGGHDRRRHRGAYLVRPAHLAAGHSAARRIGSRAGDV